MKIILNYPDKTIIRDYPDLPDYPSKLNIAKIAGIKLTYRTVEEAKKFIESFMSKKYIPK